MIRATVQLLNPSCPDVQGLEATALADSSAVHLRIPDHLALQLKLGDDVLLGAIPMEDMDLVLQPQLQQLTVNPANPNLPLSIAKRC